MNRSRSRSRSRRQKSLIKPNSDDPEPDATNTNTQGGADNTQQTAGGTTQTTQQTTQQQNNQQQTQTNDKLEFSTAQQAFLESKINEAYGRGAAKAEERLNAKILELTEASKKKTEPEKKTEQTTDGEKVYKATEVQALLADKDTEYKTSNQKLQERIDSLLAKDKKAAITEASVKAKVLPDAVGDMGLLVSPFLKHDDQGNLTVINEQGNPRLNSEGKNMTVEEFVTKFLETKPHLKQGANTPGAGSGNTNIGGGGNVNGGKPPATIAEAVAAAVSLMGQVKQ